MGDFNMAMLRVPRELSCRGLECDVLAYYSRAFRGHDPNQIHSHRLGLDSCCIFYVKGGDVEARVNWPASHIPRLLDAGRVKCRLENDWGNELHSYDDLNHVPGKPWWNYKCSELQKETPTMQNLQKTVDEVFKAPCVARRVGGHQGT